MTKLCKMWQCGGLTVVALSAWLAGEAAAGAQTIRSVPNRTFPQPAPNTSSVSNISSLLPNFNGFSSGTQTPSASSFNATTYAQNAAQQNLALFGGMPLSGSYAAPYSPPYPHVYPYYGSPYAYPASPYANPWATPYGYPGQMPNYSQYPQYPQWQNYGSPYGGIYPPNLYPNANPYLPANNPYGVYNSSNAFGALQGPVPPVYPTGDAFGSWTTGMGSALGYRGLGY